MCCGERPVQVRMPAVLCKALQKKVHPFVERQSALYLCPNCWPSIVHVLLEAFLNCNEDLHI